jgi:zinc/manganese transport system substrate-binding protein
VKVWVRNIESALASIDFKNAKIYQKNAQDYLRELDRLDNWIKSQFQHISSEDRKIITAHDAFGYYGKAYGIKFLSPMGLTTETEPSAFAIAELIKQIRRENFSTLFVENMTNDRLMQQIAKETGIRIGGILYSDALSPIGEAGGTYIKMMEHNTNLFKAAMN